MTTVNPRKVLKSALVGFGLGLLFMLGIGFVAPKLGSVPQGSAASTR